MKNLSLDELITEFERLSLDERLYFQIISEENLDVAISFNAKDNRSWSVWFICSEKASKQKISSIFLVRVLQAFKVPLHIFYDELSAILLTQAAYADEFIKQITSLLGNISVQSSIKQTQEFMEILKTSVDTQFKQANDSFKIIQATDESYMQKAIDMIDLPTANNKKTIKLSCLDELNKTTLLNNNKDKRHLKIISTNN